MFVVVDVAGSLRNWHETERLGLSNSESSTITSECDYVHVRHARPSSSQGSDYRLLKSIASSIIMSKLEYYNSLLPKENTDKSSESVGAGSHSIG